MLCKIARMPMCGETFLELLPNQYGSEALYFYSANR